MIEGLGIDIIEVKRVQKRIEAEKGFREYVFSSAEIAYCEKKTNKYEHYAARFAAKEAFLKALGTGWTSEYSFPRNRNYSRWPGQAPAGLKRSL
jgi:holo-[acyl-carrier protein] synthase